MEMSNVDEKERALLHSQAHIWNQSHIFVKSMSLKCAVELGIPDIINKHGRPMPLSDLVPALGVNPSKAGGVYRLMRILVHSGFFTNEENSEKGYLLTPAAELLLKDGPFNAAQFVSAVLDPIMLKPWHHMGEWFRNDDQTPFHTAYGTGLYNFCGTEPGYNHLYNKAMACDSRLIATVVVKHCKGVFEGLNSLVDVAGGTGTMAKALADNFSKLKLIVLDLPHVVAEMKGSDTENLKFVGGDMFRVIPSADAVLLKWILTSYSDEDAGKILKRCKEAIPSKGGKVIVIDQIMDQMNKKGDDYTETKLLLDMTMMTLHHSRERTEKEWANLFSESGFTRYKITLVLGVRSLIEVYP